MHRRLAIWIVATLLAALPGPARAVIETTSSASCVRLAPSSMPGHLITGNFTVFAWIWPEALEPAPRGVLQVPGVFELTVAGSSVSARVLRGSPNPASISATVEGVLQSGRWNLLAASYARGTGTLQLHACAAGGSPVSATSTDPTLAWWPSGPATGELALGAHPAALPAIKGAYGPIAIRNHAVGISDFGAVAFSKRFWAVYDGDTTAAGGNMNGPPGCVWMIGHAMTTFPIDAGVGGFVFDRAAVVGKPVTTTNVHIFNYELMFGNSLRVVRPVTAATDCVYRSHADAPYAGWFVRDVLPPSLPINTVPAVAPLTRQLITGPRQLLRVMISGNSRAIGGHDFSGEFPGNFASGFIERNRPHVAGVLFRSAHLQSGGSPWFGFDSKYSMPYQSAPGTIVDVSDAASSRNDFSRFWTGSGSLAAAGPGMGLLVLPGGYYALKCKPEPGTLLVATEPLVVRAHVLRFPGSSTVRWRPNKGAYQMDLGEFGAATSISLDTTEVTHAFGPADLCPDPATLVLQGNLTGGVDIGHACFISSGTGAGSLSTVTSVQQTPTTTVIQLSHPLRVPPAQGSQLRFGPWHFHTLTYLWPALAPTDPMVFRGLELAALTGGAGVVVYAFDAWRPDVNGLAFGASGWGGHGYHDQVDRSFPGSHERWIASAAADVWIQTPANQASQPNAMSEFAELVHAALPDAELTWAFEMAHGEFIVPASTDPWIQYALKNAASAGAAAIISPDDPRLGTWLEQYSDGLRADADHLCQRGNRRQADVWTDMLKRAAIDPCLRADLNFDGQETIGDFGAFQGLFVSGDLLADMNGDGQLTIQDFGAFQAAFAGGC